MRYYGQNYGIGWVKIMGYITEYIGLTLWNILGKNHGKYLAKGYANYLATIMKYIQQKLLDILAKHFGLYYAKTMGYIGKTEMIY